MKILYIHQYFKTPDQSGGLRSYEFSRRLVQSGHKVVMLSSDTSGSHKGWKVENIDGIELHKFSNKYTNKMTNFQRIMSFISFTFNCSLHALRINADRVICSSTPLTVALPGILHRMFKGTKFIFEVRDVWPEIPYAMKEIGFLTFFIASMFEKIAYFFAHKIICLSSDMAKSVSKRISGKKICIIPNCSDPELFILKNEQTPIELKPLENIRKTHEFVVFYTGTFGKVNNLSYLLDIASYSNGEVGFVLIGDGREKNKLLRKAQTLNLRNLYFLPEIKKSHLKFVHNLCDMSASTVLPIKELNSNSANKIFDAFASGMPILINHEGWLKDLIDENKCGVVLDANASSNEYAKLLDFLKDSDRYKNARKASKDLGLTVFNRDILFKEFHNTIVS